MVLIHNHIIIILFGAVLEKSLTLARLDLAVTILFAISPLNLIYTHMTFVKALFYEP